MPIKYVLLVNKQGQTRLAKYYEDHSIDERLAIEGEVVRKCLGRSENQKLIFTSCVLALFGAIQCSFFEYKTYKIVYRRYASLYFIVGVDEYENELAILELIHLIVETFDSYFNNVCELDIMFNLEKGHMILDEVLLNGRLVETSQKHILEPVLLIDQASKD
jgi:AP-4 complex subunit sigma-1